MVAAERTSHRSYASENEDLQFKFHSELYVWKQNPQNFIISFWKWTSVLQTLTGKFLAHSFPFSIPWVATQRNWFPSTFFHFPFFYFSLKSSVRLKSSWGPEGWAEGLQLFWSRSHGGWQSCLCSGHVESPVQALGSNMYLILPVCCSYSRGQS